MYMTFSDSLTLKLDCLLKDQKDNFFTLMR